MACSGLLQTEQHFSIRVAEIQTSGSTGNLESMDHSPHPLVTVGNTYKKKRWLVQVDPLTQRWSEPEPRAPMSQGVFALSKGLALPSLQMSSGNICAVGFNSDLVLCFLSLVLESFIPYLFATFCIGYFL